MKRRAYTPRNFGNGAQGVITWSRRLAGRRFWFSLVAEGWWGVGDTGWLRVSAERPGLEGYPEYRYQAHAFRLADPVAAADRLRAERQAQSDKIRQLQREWGR